MCTQVDMQVRRYLSNAGIQVYIGRYTSRYTGKYIGRYTGRYMGRYTGEQVYR